MKLWLLLKLTNAILDIGRLLRPGPRFLTRIEIWALRKNKWLVGEIFRRKFDKPFKSITVPPCYYAPIDRKSILGTKPDPTGERHGEEE